MQFDLTTDDADETTEAVAPGTSCTIFPCGGVETYACTCPDCGS